MTDDRDPRRDPRPGDVLRKGHFVREVLYREHGSGITQMANRIQVADAPYFWWGAPEWPEVRKEKRPGLRQFRKWAQKSEVVHKAEEPTK